jgi:hypothetical protein
MPASRTLSAVRFKRNIILNRVLLHLAQQRNLALPDREWQAIVNAHLLVSGVWSALLTEDMSTLTDDNR